MLTKQSATHLLALKSDSGPLDVHSWAVWQVVEGRSARGMSLVLRALFLQLPWSLPQNCKRQTEAGGSAFIQATEKHKQLGQGELTKGSRTGRRKSGSYQE